MTSARSHTQSSWLGSAVSNELPQSQLVHNYLMIMLKCLERPHIERQGSLDAIQA